MNWGLEFLICYLEAHIRKLLYIANAGHNSTLMHAKFMHVLCSLLMHIPTYLDVMRCYNHDFIDLWGFSIDLPYLGSAEQEIPLLRILCF
jgi:hypothetical protein